MDLVAIGIEATDREIVDAYEAYTPLGEVFGALARDVDEVREEVIGAPRARRVTRLQENPLARLDVVARELRRLSRLRVLDLDHPRRANRGVERHLIEGDAAGDVMEGWVHMRARVRTHRD